MAGAVVVVAKPKVAVADEAANPSRQFAGPSCLQRKGWARWPSFLFFLLLWFRENSLEGLRWKEIRVLGSPRNRCVSVGFVPAV